MSNTRGVLLILLISATPKNRGSTPYSLTKLGAPEFNKSNSIKFHPSLPCPRQIQCKGQCLVFQGTRSWQILIINIFWLPLVPTLSDSFKWRNCLWFSVVVVYTPSPSVSFFQFSEPFTMNEFIPKAFEIDFISEASMPTQHFIFYRTLNLVFLPSQNWP